MEIEKICTKCSESKPLSAFGPHSRGKYGRQARCRKCEYKRKEAYYAANPDARKRHRIQSSQKRSERYRQDIAFREHIRKVNRESWIAQYNVTSDMYASLFAAQQGLCAICDNPETIVNHYGAVPLSIDHDHKTGAVRGLLCFKCNTKLAALEDELFVGVAMAYLEKHSRA